MILTWTAFNLFDSHAKCLWSKFEPNRLTLRRRPFDLKFVLYVLDYFNARLRFHSMPIFMENLLGNNFVADCKSIRLYPVKF